MSSNNTPELHVPRQAASSELRRSVGLVGLVLYGLGVTIGAGIYVLVGETVVRAGPYAPGAFLLSAFVMGFTAASFAELSGRIPRAAGEAVYVEESFGLPWLTILVGLAVLFEAVITAAAIAVGASGYVGQIVPLPPGVVVIIIVLTMASVAGYGIRETVIIAGAMTLVEVAGLLLIIGAGFASDQTALVDLPASLLPPLTDGIAISGVFSAALIAFFAFIGFDDVVNLVEETRNPKKLMPWAITITLVIVTVLYVLVAFVAASMISPAEFEGSTAPLSLLFERMTGLPPVFITIIAILATVNGVGIILTMAARVAYGMAGAGRLPAWIGKVSPVTHTPLTATVLVTVCVLALALFFPLDVLAETSSTVLLAVFVMVNAALVWLKLKRRPAPVGGFRVPLIVPLIGAALCLLLLLSSAIVG